MSKSWRTALVVGTIIAVFAATSAGAAKFITGKDIKNGSIGAKDLSSAAKRALKGKSGATGPQGPAGPQGVPGPSGPSSLHTTLRSKNFTIVGAGTATGEVRCPAGMIAVGGGVSPGDLFTVTDQPSADGAGWVGSADGDSGGTMRVTAICTPGSATVLPLGS